MSFGMDADSLLELLYYAFTEYNTVESPEFKEEIDSLKEKLRGLADTDEVQIICEQLFGCLENP